MLGFFGLEDEMGEGKNLKSEILSWCVDESAYWTWTTEHLFLSFNYPLLACINESMFV